MKKIQVKLPDDIKTKIYKTGQTRGADDDVIYQKKMFYFNVYFRSFIGKIVYKSAVLDCPNSHV